MAAPLVTGFRDLELVATGASGSVYRAVDEHIGRVVAIRRATTSPPAVGGPLAELKAPTTEPAGVGLSARNGNP